MKKNVGTKDSLIRIALAFVIILVALFFIEGAVLRIISAVVAATLAITAFVNMCPIYHMLGKSTCDVEETKEAQPPSDAPVEPTSEEVEAAQPETSSEDSDETPERTS